MNIGDFKRSLNEVKNTYYKEEINQKQENITVKNLLRWLFGN